MYILTHIHIHYVIDAVPLSAILELYAFRVTCGLFFVVQTCKLKDVDAFIEQFNNLFYTTLRECLRILGENVVILVIFC